LIRYLGHLCYRPTNANLKYDNEKTTERDEKNGDMAFSVAVTLREWNRLATEIKLAF